MLSVVTIVCLRRPEAPVLRPSRPSDLHVLVLQVVCVVYGLVFRLARVAIISVEEFMNPSSCSTLASLRGPNLARRGLEGCVVLPPQDCVSLVIDAGVFCCRRGMVIVHALSDCCCVSSASRTLRYEQSSTTH